MIDEINLIILSKKEPRLDLLLEDGTPSVVSSWSDSRLDSLCLFTTNSSAFLSFSNCLLDNLLSAMRVLNITERNLLIELIIDANCWRTPSFALILSLLGSVVDFRNLAPDILLDDDLI